MAEPPRVYVAYDYGCAYSYVGHERARRLDERVDVEWVWIPWEMYPSITEQGDPIEGVDEPATHPVKGRPGELADELDLTLYWPPKAPNTELALRGSLVAGEQGSDVRDRYHDAMFDAVWQKGRNIGDPDVFAEIVEAIGLDSQALIAKARSEAIDERTQGAAEAVERLALSRRPTFVFGDHRIVGTDAFEPTVARPIEAFVERWERDGPGAVTTLADDLGIADLVAE